MTELTCIKCRKPLVKPKTGRMPSYCGEACRRSAEYERTRLNRHIDRLEADYLKLSVTDKTHYKDHLGRTTADQRADCQKNIDELEARLRLLLESSSDE